MSDEPKKSKGKGCFFYGCLTCIVVFILGGVGLYFGAKYAANYFVQHYTSDQPLKLPDTQLPADELKSLLARADKFSDEVKAGTNSPTLELTSEEINALIANKPDLAMLKGKFYAKIEGDKLTGTTSVPLDELNLPSLKGRYLNGNAGLKVNTENGVLYVTLDSFAINGQAMPEDALKQMRARNLADEINKDPKKAAEVRKIESLSVKDGKLIIKMRPSENPPKASEPAPK